MEPNELNVKESTKIWAVYGQTMPMGDPYSEAAAEEVQLFWELKRRTEGAWDTSLRAQSVCWYEVTKGTLEQVQVCHFFKYKKSKWEFFAVLFKEENEKQFVFEVQASKLRPLKTDDVVTVFGYADHNEEPKYTEWYGNFYAASAAAGGLFDSVRNETKKTVTKVSVTPKRKRSEKKLAREKPVRNATPARPPTSSSSEEDVESSNSTDSSSGSDDTKIPTVPNRAVPYETLSHPLPEKKFRGNKSLRKYKKEKAKNLKTQYEQALQTIKDLRAEVDIRKVSQGLLPISPSEEVDITHEVLPEQPGRVPRPFNKKYSITNVYTDLYNESERVRADALRRARNEVEDQLLRERATHARDLFFLRLARNDF